VLGVWAGAPVVGAGVCAGGLGVVAGAGLEPPPPAAVQAAFTPEVPRTRRATAPRKPALMYVMGSLCSYRLRSSA
jgi:hypothetical protein